MSAGNPEERARAALASGHEAEALVEVLAEARRQASNARLWQWTGLLQRSLQNSQAAIDSFDTAARLAPTDALIAMGRAQVCLEAGLDAREMFERSIRLSATGDALLGLCAARFACGEGKEALADLAAVLDRNPGWVQGHRQWAQLASMVGQPDRATETLNRALEKDATALPLWLAKLNLLEAAERAEEAVLVCEEAIVQTGQRSALALPQAAALSDAGHAEAAGRIFAKLGVPTGIAHAIHLARHLVRSGDKAGLARLADQWMATPDAHQFWPYASIAWRWTNDPRWEWLEGDERLVVEMDLADGALDLNRTVDFLNGLHDRSGRFLDQSVRGGSQTDGPLLSRINPDILALRAALVAAVQNYVAQLPPVDPDHPMLSRSRSSVPRFSGSWSVRLTGRGFHTPHIHPQGWISSAFYVALPELGPSEGRLNLGEPPPDLRTGLGPLRQVEPRPGKLVLFPSMMWHGTTPFSSGTRMTVAFDVAPPKV